MRAFGRKFSNWWFLLLVPVFLLSLPLLLMLFFMGNDLAGAIVGPPALWNRPRHTPAEQELMGRYQETERHLDRTMGGSPAVLDLRSDGSMFVRSLPVDMGSSSCVLSGAGRWTRPDEEDRIDLTVIADGSAHSCASGRYEYLQVAGRAAPYSLYWIVADPDSGTGVWLKRR